MDIEQQKRKLLDLYLSDSFPKEMLQERKGRVEETISNLRREQADIAAHIRTQVMSDDEIEEVAAF